MNKKLREFLENLRYDFFELPDKVKLAIASAAAVVLIAASFGVGKYLEFRKMLKEKASVTEKEPVRVEAAIAKIAPFKDSISLMGEIKGAAEANLRFESPGVVGSIKHRDGDVLKKGELIASLEQKAALLKARHSEIEYENKKRLHLLGGISDSAFEQAKCEHELAMGELEKTIIVAPKDGVVGKWRVETGEYVTPNEDAVSFVDVREIFVECDVIESDLPKVSAGQRARITVDAFPEDEFDGAVTAVSKVVAGRSRSAPLRIKIFNPRKEILPGMFARSELVVYEAGSALAVPSSYFQTEEGKYFLWLAQKDTTGGLAAQKRSVEIEYFGTDRLLVKEGVREGDIIITQVPFGLAAGDKVSAVYSDGTLSALPPSGTFQ